jgi:hypothetical protein
VTRRAKAVVVVLVICGGLSTAGLLLDRHRQHARLDGLVERADGLDEARRSGRSVSRSRVEALHLETLSLPSRWVEGGRSALAARLGHLLDELERDTRDEER